MVPSLHPSGTARTEGGPRAFSMAAETARIPHTWDPVGARMTLLGYLVLFNRNSHAQE